eukprot:gene14435-biopygen21640
MARRSISLSLSGTGERAFCAVGCVFGKFGYTWAQWSVQIDANSREQRSNDGFQLARKFARARLRRGLASSARCDVAGFAIGMLGRAGHQAQLFS